jgi:hypothetical protein
MVENPSGNLRKLSAVECGRFPVVKYISPLE